MSAPRPVVLLVEDEPAQREALAYNLAAEGLEVIEASDGEAAVTLAREVTPDVVVLDWMLPELSGIEVCRRLRAAAGTRTVPIIMISARTEESDRVRGLEMGADDYVLKPYSLAEFMARVRTQLRRTRAADVGGMLSFNGIQLDGEQHRVTRDGTEVRVGPTEFRLLATFLEKPGRVWSREQLLDRVWGRDVYVDSRTVDVHVGRLRKALRAEGQDDPIRTVRGAGYALG